MEKVSAWVRSQDQFGSVAAFNYRGQAGYGTQPGGLISICAMMFISIFSLCQIIGLFSKDTFNSSVEYFYNDFNIAELQ